MKLPDPDDTTGPVPPRQPGQWPVDRRSPTEPEDEPDRRGVAEQARFHLTMGVIRAALEEQPTPGLVRATGRRWIATVAQLTEEIAQQVQTQNRERDQ